jgi:hypothetical protein
MKHKTTHKKKKGGVKKHHVAGSGLGAMAVPFGHHLTNDWTIHGVLHEITHNGIYTAIGAAVIMGVMELIRRSSS